jgi:hypothetical protein
MEERASRYGVQLRMYLIGRRGKLIMGSSLAWGVVEGLITPHRKKKLVKLY